MQPFNFASLMTAYYKFDAKLQTSPFWGLLLYVLYTFFLLS